MRVAVVALGLMLVAPAAWAAGPGTSKVNKDVKNDHKKEGRKWKVLSVGPDKGSTWENSAKTYNGVPHARAARKWRTVFEGPIKGSKRVVISWVYYLKATTGKWFFEDLQGYSFKYEGMPNVGLDDIKVTDWSKAIHKRTLKVLVELLAVNLDMSTWSWNADLLAGDCEGTVQVVVAWKDKSGPLTLPFKARFERKSVDGPFTTADDRAGSKGNAFRQVKAAHKTWTAAAAPLFGGGALTPKKLTTDTTGAAALPARGGRGGRGR